MTEGKSIRIPRTLGPGGQVIDHPPEEGRGLKVDKAAPIGVTAEQKKSLQEHWNTASESEKLYEKEGFGEIKKPTFNCPEVDEQVVTNPDSTEFTTVYVHLLGWYSYCAELLAKVDVYILQYENLLDVLGAETRDVARKQHAEGKKPTVDELKDRLLLNPRYLETLHELQKYQQHKKLLASRLESIDRSLKVISRQVTIRTLDMEAQRTGSNLPGRGSPNRSRFG